MLTLTERERRAYIENDQRTLAALQQSEEELLDGVPTREEIEDAESDRSKALQQLEDAEAQNRRMRELLETAIERAGFHVSGPTDHRAAEDGEPQWVCNARAEIAEIPA